MKGNVSGSKSYDAARFGEWVRRTRESRGIGVGVLAERAGIHTTTLRKFEQGTHKGLPSVEMFERLAHGLDLDLGYLLHKAGYDVGADGVDIARLTTTEAIIQAFDDHAQDVRLAMAMALDVLDREGTDGKDHYDVIHRLGRALGALDLVTERLRDRREA